MTGIVHVKFSQAMTLPNKIDEYFKDPQTQGRMLELSVDQLSTGDDETITMLNKHKDKIMKVSIDQNSLDGQDGVKAVEYDWRIMSFRDQELEIDLDF